jgi:outer membrane biosynthesis protein TonB
MRNQTMKKLSFGIYKNILPAKILSLAVGLAFLFSVLNYQVAAQTGAIGSIDEGVAGGGINEPVKKMQTTETKTSSGSASKSSKSKTKTKTASTKTKTVVPPKSPTRGNDDGFVLGDKYTFLNDEIVEIVRPIYRKSARAAGAVGLVQVEVLIDSNGNVISAKPRTGNALLHPEAEKAALATRFNKPSVYGKPAKALGFIVYRFGTEEDEYNMKKKSNPQ